MIETDVLKHLSVFIFPVIQLCSSPSYHEVTLQEFMYVSWQFVCVCVCVCYAALALY